MDTTKCLNVRLVPVLTLNGNTCCVFPCASLKVCIVFLDDYWCDRHYLLFLLFVFYPRLNAFNDMKLRVLV